MASLSFLQSANDVSLSDTSNKFFVISNRYGSFQICAVDSRVACVTVTVHLGECAEYAGTSLGLRQCCSQIWRYEHVIFSNLPPFVDFIGCPVVLGVLDFSR